MSYKQKWEKTITMSTFEFHLSSSYKSFRRVRSVFHGCNLPADKVLSSFNRLLWFFSCFPCILSPLHASFFTLNLSLASFLQILHASSNAHAPVDQHPGRQSCTYTVGVCTWHCILLICHKHSVVVHTTIIVSHMSCIREKAWCIEYNTYAGQIQKEKFSFNLEPLCNQ